MLAKTVLNKESDQRTLELMDIVIERNAYGRQAESFEDGISSGFGTLNAVFIRAPRIRSLGKGVAVLANRGAEAVACEEKMDGRYYLAACFHPELATELFHERFLKNIQ